MPPGPVAGAKSQAYRVKPTRYPGHQLQATSIWGQFRMILKKLQATSHKRQAASNKLDKPGI